MQIKLLLLFINSIFVAATMQYIDHNRTMFRTIIQSIDYLILPGCIGIICFTGVILCIVMRSLHGLKKLEKQIELHGPINTSVLYVIDIPRNILVLNSITRFVWNKIMNKATQHIHDIDDSPGIIDRIRSAALNGRGLLIFINTTGGAECHSDAICQALKTYISFNTHNPHTLPKKNSSQFTGSGVYWVTCVVDETAMSAGTMLALSGDELYVDSFASLGPTDPQITIQCDEHEYTTISCGFYQDILRYRYRDIVAPLEHEKFVVMMDRIQSYHHNINMFKSLRQYQLASKINKLKLLKTFCYNTLPHHQTIGYQDLMDHGINVQVPTKRHKLLLSYLKQYNHILYGH
jgi:hypothetical protein